jgi:hypothetical protein
MAPPAKPKPPTQQQQIDQLRRDQQQLLQQQQQQQQAFEKYQKRIEIRRKADRIVTTFHHSMQLKAARWRICVRSIGSAYAEAAQKHRDALQKADKAKALEPQLLFSAITMVMSGGVSMIYSLAGLNEAKGLLAPLLKDTSMAAAGEGSSAIGPPAVAVPPRDPAPKTTADDAIDKEPQHYQNSMLDKVDAWCIDAFQHIVDQQDKIEATPLEAWDNWDEVAAQKAYDDVWKKLPQGMAENTTEKDIEAMAIDLERGMWAIWMDRLHTVSIMTSGGDAYNWGYSDDVGKKVDTYEGVSGPIADRFQALGILRDAGTTISMWHSAESEDRKLLAWAQRYKAPGGHPVWNS